MKIKQTLVIAFSFLLLLSCNKEKHWSTEILFSADIELTSAKISADFSLPNNNEKVFIGICWSENPMPTTENWVATEQTQDSDVFSFSMNDLLPLTQYYVRSYIKTNKGDIIYSDQITFTTAGSSIAPCETELGIINYNGTDYSMADLSVYPFGNYSLETSSAFGELTFEFYTRPTKAGMLKTVKYHSDLNSNTIIVEGIFGSCFHGTTEGLYVYVDILEDDKISMTFCELTMSPSGACTGVKVLTGELHE